MYIINMLKNYRNQDLENSMIWMDKNVITVQEDIPRIIPIAMIAIILLKKL